MRVLIVAVGSVGDVSPYVGLGSRLQAEGHDVAVATHEAFEHLVRAAGLTLRAVSGDPRSLIRARMATGLSDEERRALTGGYLNDVGESIADAADAGADVILTCLGQAPLSMLVAQAADVPVVGAYVIPAVPTAEFPLPGSPPPEDGDNRAAGTQVLLGARSVYADVLPRLTGRLGLAKADGDRMWDRWVSAKDWPVFLGYSEAVVPKPGDWADNVQVVGYWWPAIPDDWQPPSALVDFLDAGPAPVFIGFGSMAVGSGAVLGPVIRDAVRAAGVRAVVQSGWAQLEVEDDDILTVGDVPHEWLLPRMSAAVHHAGAGTTGAVLRAGIPAVTVPVMADQPFWASRVHALGAGPAPLPFQDLSAPSLAAAIASVGRADFRDTAQRLGTAVRSDDGAGAVARYLNRLGG